MDSKRTGELIIFAEASLWGLFPVITVLSENKLSPLVSLGFSTLFSCIFFSLVLTYKKKWYELKNTFALKDILLTTVILGILYYLLSFFGLAHTDPGNASLISESEIFFSYLFFHVWKKDRLPTYHILGALLMFIGVAVIFYPNIHGLRIGDLLILSAALIAPLGNFFQKRARTEVSSESILFIRSLLSAIVIFGLVFIFHDYLSFFSIKSSFVALLINGILVLGLSKILWIEGIHRISVMKANALGAIAPLLTLFFSWLVLQKVPTAYQLISFIPMFFGIILLSKNRA